MLLDPEDKVLRHGAGPSLPDEYNDAIDGVAIGPSVGSCGTAAYTGKEVLVEDIQTDPLWKDFKGLAGKFGLRACWSTPIHSSRGDLLATFAIYRNEVGAPTAAERELVETLARTAAIAIERSNAEDAIEEANRRKDEFLALLGHELRNPLAPIVTALELMKINGVGAERERDAIERNVHHMMQLVDDLLDVSRIVRGKITLSRQKLDMAEVLREAVDIATPLLEERNHHLSFETDPELIVHADRTRMVQVFSNLLTNAAKYTAPGGSVRVTAKRRGEATRPFG